MAATQAPPAWTGIGAGHHGHSHSRRSASQRIPLQPATLSDGTHLNGGSSITEYLKPQMAPHHQHSKTVENHHEVRQDSVSAFPLLSSPHPSFSTPTTSRAKSMERRKSVGLPTHLRLEGSGYGFPAPKQRFRSNTIEPGAR